MNKHKLPIRCSCSKSCNETVYYDKNEVLDFIYHNDNLPFVLKENCSDSTLVLCFYCFTRYNANGICWINEGTLALCGECGIDAVIYKDFDPLLDDIDFVKDLHHYGFGCSAKELYFRDK